MKKRSNTQDIGRKAAGALLDRILKDIAAWTDDPRADRDFMLARLTSYVELSGLQVPRRCDGEAHSNAFIDHCPVCSPHWGVIHRDVRVK